MTIEHIIELSVNNLNILHERVANRQSAARNYDALNIFNVRVEFYYSERLNLKNIFIKNNIKYSEVDGLQDNHIIYNCLCFLLSNWLIKR